MGAKYIFRLDDIAENMNWDNYFSLKKIFDNYGVKPIIGVIPNNEDTELLDYPRCEFNFWKEIRELQEMGWSIALHGYNHKYLTNDSGILDINYRSEFAGVSYEIQNKKILAGKEILKKNGIIIDAFMAPAHSFDENTLNALIDNDIKTVTDGYTFYPYYFKGILFVPQLLSTPRKMPFGIYTWCLHPNIMNSRKINAIEEFIKQNQDNIISFTEAKKYVKNSKLNAIGGRINKRILKMIRK
ncbi:MAG TPA: DUF2334 domain-containing protein [Tissierellia bacterium]|nr:DUF2334 domain-containing protein [Tissierellia bacterium]